MVEIDERTEGVVASLWICDTCGRGFRLNKHETLVHTAETGHENYHTESYLIMPTGVRNISVMKLRANGGLDKK